ncbi:MAG: hypothetical protein RQ855_01565 [Desulfurococcales archaeon]|nr:hypothetical protein [Desulfurococcales archaeon]
MARMSRKGEIVIGGLIGLIYYFIYIVIIPQIHRLLGANSVRSDIHVDIPLAGFFLSLGMLASITKGTIFSFIINALIKILGLIAYLYIVHGRPIIMEASAASYTMTIAISPEPIIYVVSIWTLATILIDILAIVERLRPSVPGAIEYIREVLE